MTYRRVNIETRRRTLLLIGVLFVGAVVLLISPVRGSIGRVIYTTAPTLWDFGGDVGMAWHAFWGSFHERQDLVLQNKALEDQVNRMAAHVLDRNVLAERVLELEGVLGRAEYQKHLPARVLTRPGSGWYDTFIVDQGKNASVAEGDTVVYSGSVLIGYVAEVYPTSSKVFLYSSPGRETSVLLGSTKTPGTAEGRGMGNFLAHVPQGNNLLVGDPVRLQGSDLLLGFVGTIREEPTKPFTEILFRLPVNIAEMDVVEILIGI